MKNIMKIGSENRKNTCYILGVKAPAEEDG